MVNSNHLPPPTTKRRNNISQSSEEILSSSNISSVTSRNCTTSAKMSTRQSYVFLGLTTLLAVIVTAQSGPVSTTTQAEVSTENKIYVTN